MSYDDERQVARAAQAVITSLTPQMQRTERYVVAVRFAAVTAGAAVKNRPNEGALDDARTEAATVLGGLHGLMELNAVPPDMIERARNAVTAWLRELAVLER
jgi:hypothetical protein